MNFALFVSQGNRDSPDLVQLKARVVLMEVRSHPAYPNTAGLLTWEDPHWIVVLQKEQEVQSHVNQYRS